MKKIKFDYSSITDVGLGPFSTRFRWSADLEPERKSQSAVIVISSHVVRGSVGNRAAVFALEALGHPVWALPTVILPWHPGHGPASRTVSSELEFGALIDDLCSAPWLGEVGAVLSGYLGAPYQAPHVARLVECVKQKNSATHYVCDPVIGDFGGLYVPEATALAIRKHLIPLATIVTPNRFELGWMAGGLPETSLEIVDAARDIGVPRTLVTSAVAMMADSVANLLVGPQGALQAEHRLIDDPPNGLGDLMSAVFLARILAGMSDEQALKSASASVFEILARTRKNGADELTLESEIGSLVRPMAMVQARAMHLPKTRTSPSSK